MKGNEFRRMKPLVERLPDDGTYGVPLGFDTETEILVVRRVHGPTYKQHFEELGEAYRILGPGEQLERLGEITADMLDMTAAVLLKVHEAIQNGFYPIGGYLDDFIKGAGRERQA